VSVLAHYLEEEGLATTVVSLVRLHSEIIRPPRSLFVPFELGRPVGPPNNNVLQRHVLEQALGLLESDDGPSLISDFDQSNDGTAPDKSWSPPATSFSNLDALDVADLKRRLKDEIEILAPSYALAKKTRGRSSVGVSRLTIDEIAEHILSFLNGPHQESPREDLSSALVLRFGADDLKAFYLEAASHGGSPSSWQLGNWFWRDTVAGQILISLRAAAMDHDDKRFNIVGSKFLVPVIWVSELKL
tara:strand:- start:37117 stop:37851 length:735 start_codon:yes stop_codon:yes gene_type:complete